MDTTARSIADHLEEVPWFRQLTKPVRERILDDARDSRHAKGELVTRAGDPAVSWLYVADGLLKVSAVTRGGRLIMYTGVPEGAWFGEGSVVKRELRRYDIVAMRDSRLIHMPASTFRWLMDTNIDFNHAIVAQLNERLSQYISMVEIDRMEDPVVRVARALAILYNPVLYPRMTSAVPLSQTELGELAGLTRQSVAAALTRLKHQGLVSTGYGRLIVLDLARLRNYDERGTKDLPPLPC